MLRGDPTTTGDRPAATRAARTGWTHSGPLLAMAGVAAILLGLPAAASASCTAAAAVKSYTGIAQLGFGVDASGDSPGTGGGTAYSRRAKLPRSLKLDGTLALPAYETCSGAMILGGKACYTFGGGWSTMFLMLKQCQSVISTPNCGPDGERAGTATFA